jgi:hypothetical protein
VRGTLCRFCILQDGLIGSVYEGVRQAGFLSHHSNIHLLPGLDILASKLEHAEHVMEEQHGVDTMAIHPHNPPWRERLLACTYDQLLYLP